MNRFARYGSFGLLLLVFSACTPEQPFRPEQIEIPTVPYDLQLDGKVLVFNTATDVGYIFSGEYEDPATPSRSTGDVTLDMPVGSIVKAAAMRAFSAQFREGGQSSSSLSSSSDYKAIVRPRVLKYRPTKELHGILSPHYYLEIMASVEVLNRDGDTIWKQLYGSGPVELRRSTREVTERTILELMVRAAVEVREKIRSESN